jgi:Fe-S oxidoreductase/nitrate reductase gamma subunit
MGQAEVRTGDLRGVITYLLGHKRILKNGSVGAFHFFLFWGVVVHIILVIAAQFGFTIASLPANILSFAADTLGGFMLLGILFFLARRLKATSEKAPKGLLVPLVLLLVIFLSGFLAEGTRLRLTESGFSWVSPAGWVFSTFLPSSPLFMQLMIRLHFFAVLFLMAVLPFTFMRHLAADVLNIYYREKGPGGALRQISLLEGSVGAKRVNDFTWKQLLDAEACVSCGRCDKSCPAFLSEKPLSPQKVIRNILDQMEKVNLNGGKFRRLESPILESVITGDEIWSCTVCMACLETCPVCIPCFDKLMDMRRNLVMRESKFYPELGAFFRSVETYGDTFGKGKAFREDWAAGLDLKVFPECQQAETLFWVGCQATFHERGRLIAASLARIFKTAGIDFAILGKNEYCCGDPIRRVGNEYLFQGFAQRNIELLDSLDFKRIVTYCPHCFNTLKNEYPQFNGRFEVVHYTELLKDLIMRGDLKTRRETHKKVVYHDPCYLSRANDIHQNPRDILESIPGMELSEPGRSRMDTFCCGAGGGHMWMREAPGRKLNEVRTEELLKKNPEMIISSCPYCLVMFEDALSSLGAEEVKCLDLVELIRDVS